MPSTLPIVPLDGHSTIPTSLPLEAIATRMVVPRDINIEASAKSQMNPRYRHSQRRWMSGSRFRKEFAARNIAGTPAWCRKTWFSRTLSRRENFVSAVRCNGRKGQREKWLWRSFSLMLNLLFIAAMMYVVSYRARSQQEEEIGRKQNSVLLPPGALESLKPSAPPAPHAAVKVIHAHCVGGGSRRG